MLQNGNIYKKQPWKEYLHKDFGAELNYKLWSTKGTRFCAHRRYMKKSTLSMYTLGFLSAYIIIINLFVLFPSTSIFFILPQTMTIITIALSILVLVFSQLEVASNYALSADRFHRCAMEIGKLYNEWRYIKTCTEKEDDKNKAIVEIKDKYEKILFQYENHEDIDYQIFKTKHVEYYKLNKVDVIIINIKYFLKVKSFYHLLILLPVLLLIFSLLVNF